MDAVKREGGSEQHMQSGLATGLWPIQPGKQSSEREGGRTPHLAAPDELCPQHRGLGHGRRWELRAAGDANLRGRI